MSKAFQFTTFLIIDNPRNDQLLPTNRCKLASNDVSLRWDLACVPKPGLRKAKGCCSDST